MMKEEKDGGHGPARITQEDGSAIARYSVSTLVNVWPNWLSIMNEGHMNACACKTCTETNGMHEAY